MMVLPVPTRVPRMKCKYVLLVVLLGLLMPVLFLETNNQEAHKKKLNTKMAKKAMRKKVHAQTVVEYLSRPDCIPVKGHWRTRRYAAKLPHCFDFIVNNEKICADAPDLLLLIYVYSAPQDFKKRQAIRATYGNKNLVDGKTIRVVFPLGLPPVKIKNHDRTIIQQGIFRESRMYKDIVQETFVESYRNLTYKGIMSLRWINNYCSHAKYVLKADSDVFVNIFSLLTFLKMQPYVPERKLIGCEIYNHMRVIRCSARPDLKSCTTSAQYKPAYYPKYCQGAAFLLTMPTAVTMHKASLRTPIWWVDDVFITGVLLGKSPKVKRMNLKRFWVRSPGRTLNKLKLNPAHFLFASVKGPLHMAKSWNIVNNSLGHLHTGKEPDAPLKFQPVTSQGKTTRDKEDLRVIDMTQDEGNADDEESEEQTRALDDDEDRDQVDPDDTNYDDKQFYDGKEGAEGDEVHEDEDKEGEEDNEDSS